MYLTVVAVVVMLEERHRKQYCSYIASWEGKVKHFTSSTAAARNELIVMCAMESFVTLIYQRTTCTTTCSDSAVIKLE
jgi:hypothetical protein